ncbi:hypothetical protein ACFPRG_15955 [Deinococcus cellulosilyticus]
MEPPFKDRIVDVSGLGFEMPASPAFQVKAGGTFTVDLTDGQVKLLQDMEKRKSAVEYQTWMNGDWTSVEAFRIKYPITLPEPEQDGRYHNVQIRYYP